MNHSGWVATVLLVILCVSNVHALGLAYEYMDNNTINVPQGTQRVFRLTIQNEENKEFQVNVSVQSDSDIAVMRGETLVTVLPKTYNTAADILITIPNDTPINNSYHVQFTAIPTEKKSEGGQIGFSIVYSRGFTVIVGPQAIQPPLLVEQNIEQPAATLAQQSTFDNIGVTLTLIVIIAAITVLIWRSSRKLSRKITRPKENVIQENNHQESIQQNTQQITPITPIPSTIIASTTVPATIIPQAPPIPPYQQEVHQEQQAGIGAANPPGPGGHRILPDSPYYRESQSVPGQRSRQATKRVV